MTEIAGVFKHSKVNNVHMLKYAYFAEICGDASHFDNTKLYTFHATATLGPKRKYSFISSDDNPSSSKVTISTTSKGYSCNNVTFYGFNNYSYKPAKFAKTSVINPNDTTHVNANAMNIPYLYFQFMFRCDLDISSTTEKIAMYFPASSTLFSDEIISIASCQLKSVGDNIYTTSTPMFYIPAEGPSMTYFIMPVIALVNEGANKVFVDSSKDFKLLDIALIDYDNSNN